jgi:hypothetical protein
MSNTTNYRAVPIIAVVLIAAGLTAYHGLGGLKRLSSHAAAGPDTAPRAPDPRQGHWPQALAIVFSPRTPATPAQSNFAIRTATAQLNAVKTRKFNARAFAQGRFLRYSAATDLDYFLDLCAPGTEFAHWRSVDLYEAVTIPGNAGVFLRMTVVDPYNSKVAEMFYANPTY